jgi:hypothetical protein
MLQRAEFARLTKEQLEKVRELEDSLGTWVVAMKPRFQLADLSEEQLAQLREVEKELGIVLLAYEAA